MNTTAQAMQGAVAGALTLRRHVPEYSLPSGVQSRTGLPVVSNRTFVALWATRRHRLVAAARLARPN